MELGIALVWLGVFLLLAIATEWVSLRTPIPSVSVLLLLGVLVGPAGLDVLPEPVLAGEELATTLALAIVGFLLGAEFERSRLREHGRQMLVIALVSGLVTAVVVAVGLIAGGAPLPLAFALAGIATATAPAATKVVIRAERADGVLSRSLLGVTAVADALSIVLFSVLVAVGSVLADESGGGGLAGVAVREVGGGLLLGVAVGLPAALLTGRLHSGELSFLMALGVVLLVSGLGVLLEVSPLLAAVTAGAVVVNVASRHEERPFQALEGVEWPFLVVFFIFGGAALEWEGLLTYTLLTVGYVVLRILGKIGGGYLGGAAAGLDRRRRTWLGPALLPQAGIALGLALLARERFPDLAEVVVPVVVVSTVLFEVAGPVVTRLALRRTGEVGVGDGTTDAGTSR